MSSSKRQAALAMLERNASYEDIGLALGVSATKARAYCGALYRARASAGDDLSSSDAAEYCQQHAGIVWSIVRKRERDEGRQAELVNDCFAAAISSWASFGGKAKRSTWLQRVARNVCSKYVDAAIKSPQITYGYDEDSLDAKASRSKYAKSSAKAGSDDVAERDLQFLITKNKRGDSVPFTKVTFTARIDVDVDKLATFSAVGLPASVARSRDAEVRQAIANIRRRAVEIAAGLHGEPIAFNEGWPKLERGTYVYPRVWIGKPFAHKRMRRTTGPRDSAWKAWALPQFAQQRNGNTAVRFSHASMPGDVARDWSVVQSSLAPCWRDKARSTGRKIAVVPWDTVLPDSSELLERAEREAEYEAALKQHAPEGTDRAHEAALRKLKRQPAARKESKRERERNELAFAYAAYMESGIASAREWSRRETGGNFGLSRAMRHGMAWARMRRDPDMLRRLKARAQPEAAERLRKKVQRQAAVLYGADAAFRARVESDRQLFRLLEGSNKE